jgi:hypothetical protein
MKDAPIPVKLDKTRHVAWSNAAVYRLGCIRLKPEGGYATLVTMLWASLVPDDAMAFPTPEHLARFVPPERGEEFAAVINKLLEKDTDPKNADGSTQSPSPASSLD